MKIKIISALMCAVFSLGMLAGCSLPEEVSNAVTEKDAVNEEYIEQRGQTKPIADSTVSDNLTVSFLDVGQADSIFISCNGKTMLIDGGNTADGEFVCSYLRSSNVNKLDVLISTHAHEDHVGGLCSVGEEFEIDKAVISPKSHDSDCYENFINTLESSGVSYSEAEHGTSFDFGGAKVEILGPVSENPESMNSSSVVSKLTYKGVSFLFTGDCTAEEEKEILNAGYNVSCTVLKSGHHGSDYSSSYVFLREAMPEYAIISVGEDNSYGHPGDDCLSRYRDVGATVYRTDKMGTITATVDGDGALTFTNDENQSSAEQNNGASESQGEDADEVDGKVLTTSPNTATSYIGNKNSKIFHLPTCSYLPKEKNRIYFASYSEAKSKNYSPCSYCMKNK